MVNQFKYKNILLSTTFLVVLVISVFAGVLLVFKRQNVKVGAQGVNMSIVGSESFVEVGSTIMADVFIDTKGLEVTGADLRIRFDNSFFDVSSIQVGDALPVVFKDGIIVGDIAQIVLGSNVTAPKNGTGILARMTLVAKKAGTSSLNFTNLTVVSALGQDTNVVDTLTGLEIVISGPTPTGFSSATPVPTNVSSASPTAVATATTASTILPTGSGSRREDVNEDGVINIIDIGIVVDNYGANPILDVRTDIDSNGIVNIIDIGIIIDNYDR